jgi:hypothetical protein
VLHGRWLCRREREEDTDGAFPAGHVELAWDNRTHRGALTNFVLRLLNLGAPLDYRSVEEQVNGSDLLRLRDVQRFTM